MKTSEGKGKQEEASKIEGTPVDQSKESSRQQVEKRSKRKQGRTRERKEKQGKSIQKQRKLVTARHAGLASLAPVAGEARVRKGRREQVRESTRQEEDQSKGSFRQQAEKRSKRKQGTMRERKEKQGKPKQSQTKLGIASHAGLASLAPAAGRKQG